MAKSHMTHRTHNVIVKDYASNAKYKADSSFKMKLEV